MNDQGHRSAAQRVGEHFDVLIVGAGISGIGGAYHLTQQSPGTSFVVLEAFETFGGTWWSHRYPGIRSDSDLHTFGYRFKPWTGPPIATAEEIRTYMGEVIEENDLKGHIRYRHQITSATWSSSRNLWTITATKLETGEVALFTANFLFMCQGYYRHRQGYWPNWPDMERYKGRLVHSEEWADDINYTDKNVIVVGSGASAATIVPAIAKKAAQTTMLQRSPTFFRTGRNAIEIAEHLRKLDIDETWVHEIARQQILHDQAEFTERTFNEPEMVKQELLDEVQRHLGPDYDVETHFTPSYRPWRQRIAFVPDADLFKSIASGKASVITDEIERFTENGIQLKSGAELEADLIVVSTGFNMSALGDIAFEVDGKPLDFHDTITYRGMMFTGLPNLAWVFGYFRASWTLRTDLISDFVCRLVNHMKTINAGRVTVALRPKDRDMPIGDWIDHENFNPNYLMRSMHLLPKRGHDRVWQHTQDYWREKDEFPAIDLEGPEFVYGGFEEEATSDQTIVPSEAAE
ncbi:MAG: cation diffusion facilitator CzcD-associated flavoprotein CzcO [Hyphomicrobiaceae bacterium]|jgi:cation diffusion facilitator CzcD-associated flavoprotein CzcO